MATPLATRFYSLSQLADLFGLHRQTVRKRLQGVKPDGLIRGNPAFTVKSAAPRLVESYQYDEQERDPDKMDPQDAKDFWEAKLKEQKFLENDGELWRSDEVLEALSGVSKRIALALRGIPDILERRTGLDAKQMGLVEEVIRSSMKEMHDTLVDEYGADGGDSELP